MKNPHYYTAAATRELDRLAIEELNIPGFELMQRAGNAAFNCLLNNWPNVTKIIVLCGIGNNGGDGFIIAGLAKKHGLQVKLFATGDLSKINGDAKKLWTMHYLWDLRFHRFWNLTASLKSKKKTAKVKL